MSERVYVVTDIEVDGFMPGPNSMLSFASVAVTASGEQVGEFEAVLERLPGAQPNPDDVGLVAVAAAGGARRGDGRPAAGPRRDGRLRHVGAGARGRSASRRLAARLRRAVRRPLPAPVHDVRPRPAPTTRTRSSTARPVPQEPRLRRHRRRLGDVLGPRPAQRVVRRRRRTPTAPSTTPAATQPRSSRSCAAGGRRPPRTAGARRRRPSRGARRSRRGRRRCRGRWRAPGPGA